MPGDALSNLFCSLDLGPPIHTHDGDGREVLPLYESNWTWSS